MAVAPYGSWRSPITAELLVAGSASIGEVVVGTDDVWWSEARPEEGGRVQLVRHRPGGRSVDVLPEGYSARTRVHEYGGGAWWLHGDDAVFANAADQRLHRLAAGTDRPVALTPAPGDGPHDRYADGRFTADGRWFVCVRERHHDGGAEPVNEIVAVRVHPDGDPTDATVLVAGADFYAAPRLSVDGRRLAFLRWNHPDMPWDGTELCVTTVFDDRSLDAVVAGEPVVIAGSRDESVTQPEWAPDGSLTFISDRTDWWNLYRIDATDVGAALGTGARPAVDPSVALAPVEAEIGLPHWVFGDSRYAHLADGRILVAWYRDGIDHLGVVGGGAMLPLASPFTEIASVRAFGRGAVLVGASTTGEAVVAAIDVPVAPDIDGSTPVSVAVLRPARDLGVGVEWFSVPEPFEFPTTGDRTAHALFYPPTNPDFEGPEGELPPLIVMSHGGPTSAARPRLALGVQFWTSRGFGVVDVNYGGSTGYGRTYRRRLHGSWGVVDVDDVVAAAQHLVARGDADRGRLVIRGGSAGGYTTLCALTFHDVFAAGASHYGIADLAALARDTHKFEARYLDSLVGPWPGRADLYAERSPINRTADLDAPLIVLQGLDDAVVPPNQAEAMIAALEAKGLPWAYLAFEGEGHGFRRAENIRRALEAEAWFYSQVLGFELADEVEPVEIANL